jgi:hypothetical protein
LQGDECIVVYSCCRGSCLRVRVHVSLLRVGQSIVSCIRGLADDLCDGG